MKHTLKFLSRLCLILICGVVLAQPATAQTTGFADWLEDFRKQAGQAGISDITVNKALHSGLHPNDRVIELDRKQPESTMTFEKYRRLIVNRNRIDKGRRMMRQHADELARASDRFGVAPQYIVALWGIETNYGALTGGFDVIQALATLAWDGRRAEFFTKELINALKIIDQGHISYEDMTGSWAGAMGQNQFMPSSFHAYAVDGNGDGRKDIWTSLPDVFASTANYLASHGWRGDERWGRPVKVPANVTDADTGLDKDRDLSEWRDMGVTLPDGYPIPVVAGMKGAVVLPDGVGGPAFLVYNNYKAIMKWNRSTYFATSVGLLANAIASAN